MPFEIIRNDITEMQVDAIVNTANPRPIIGSGVDSAIHKKAGPRLLLARLKIGSIPVGKAAITPGFGLPARYVIHTVGPVWSGGQQGEAETLASCYRSALHLARENGCESVAFPLISTGNYGFPPALALQLAVQEFSAFLMENDMKISLVVFGQQAVALSEKLVNSVASYIDETYVREKTVEEYGDDPLSYRQERRQKDFGVFACAPAPEPMLMAQAEACVSADIDSLLQELDAGFSETLLRLIDRSGKEDSEIYKKANIDRRLFSKIRGNPGYKPSKTTVLAFAFALELSLEETRDFLARAGFALSHSSKFDVIVEYFLANRLYDVLQLNEVLFHFDQPLIGG